jgi:hypothetical protein
MEGLWKDLVCAKYTNKKPLAFAGLKKFYYACWYDLLK